MNDPISMWSGPIVCVQPPSSALPLIVSTFEPMPRMSAPIFTSIRARSWTCGSLAALPITVSPGVSAAAISAFSVAITDGSSMKTSPARRRPPCALMTMSRSCRNSAPIATNASRCGSSRRRPITSPPGGGMSACPKRASSGPGEQERGADPLGVLAVDVRVRVTSAAHSDELVVGAPFDAHADAVEHAQHRVDVADPRHVADDDLVGGQDAGGEDRQRGVLVPRGHDRPTERHTAIDDELLHDRVRQGRLSRALG